MAGRKKKTAGRMPLWLYVLIVVVIALVTYFRTSGEPEGGDPQPPAASAAAQQTPADETLTVRFLDVGQGDSILLACGDETMLIDGGPVEEGQFLVSRLNRLDVAKLTYVINTHPDEDHCGGLAAVLAKYPAEHVYSSVTEYTTKVFSNVVKYADEQGHPVEVPQTGDSWTLGSASVQVIGPVQTYSDPNNGSLVLRVDYGGTSFLFTGDMEQNAEADLMDSGANVRADVLKVGHHGSPTSSSEAFLEAVAPSIAVISVGKDNRLRSSQRGRAGPAGGAGHDDLSHRYPGRDHHHLQRPDADRHDRSHQPRACRGQGRAVHRQPQFHDRPQRQLRQAPRRGQPRLLQHRRGSRGIRLPEAHLHQVGDSGADTKKTCVPEDPEAQEHEGKIRCCEDQ